MEIRDILRDIESGKTSPVYFFFGDEPYLIDTLVKSIVQKMVDPATRDFNFDLYQGEQTDGETIVQAASSFPMMADRRVVIVKSIQRLNPTDKKRIADYVENPLDSTILVLTANKVDRRQSLYAALTKNYCWAECRPLYENQAITWVRQKLSKQSVSISQEAACFLVQQVGTSMWALHHEIEKLLTFIWDKKTITMTEVSDIAGSSRQFNAWELADAIGQRRLDKSIDILKHLIESGQSPVGLIVTLSQRILLMTHIRLLLDRGNAPSEVAKSLKLRPFFAKLYLEQARHFSADDLASAIETLKQADLALKTGYAKPLTVLILAMMDLVRVRRMKPFFRSTS